MSDPNNHLTTFSYDTPGWLIGVYQSVSSLNSVGQPNPPTSLTTSFSYDLLGHQIGLTDANNHTTSYNYDVWGRQTSEQDALNNSWNQFLGYIICRLLKSFAAATAHLSKHLRDSIAGADRNGLVHISTALAAYLTLPLKGVYEAVHQSEAIRPSHLPHE